MNLSKNLTLAEACKTNSKFDNTPGKAEIENLKLVAEKIFQPCRDHFDQPLMVNSGYRSTAVNRAIGGAPTSQHLTGQALDLDFEYAPDNKKLFDYIRENLEFDQLINENNYSWIHVSYSKTNNRKEVLEMVKVKGKSTYKKL